MNRFPKTHQLWQLTSTLARELIREPGVLFWGILFPILMSLGLGIAFTKKTDVTRNIGIIEQKATGFVNDSISQLFSFMNDNCEKNQSEDPGDYKWKLRIQDEKLGNSVFLFFETGWEEAMMHLKKGTYNLIITEDTGGIGYHFDPFNSDAQLSYLKLEGVLGAGRIKETVSESKIKPLTVTGTRYIDFLVPGLIALGIMMSCMWGISYGLIEKRSKKLLRRLVATPMKKAHFLVALITVRVVMNFVESLILFLFALFVFNIAIQGSISAMILLFITGNIAFAGIAVFVSSHTSNTEVGNGLINFVVFPMMVLSGIFFSYQNFPDWSIPVIRLLPLTILTDGIRSIFNEGAGYAQVTKPIIILASTGLIFFLAGLRIFKWH